MSPNGLNAPPAFAATTMLMQASVTKRGAPAPTAMTTAPMTSAVVRLSATGEMKKASTPVSPEQLAVAEAGPHQPGAQRVEDAPLLQRVDVGHRHQQEQQQLGVFEQHMAQRASPPRRRQPSKTTAAISTHISAGGDHDRLRLAQLDRLFGDDEEIGGGKNASAAKPTQ